SGIRRRQPDRPPRAGLSRDQRWLPGLAVHSRSSRRNTASGARSWENCTAQYTENRNNVKKILKPVTAAAPENRAAAVPAIRRKSATGRLFSADRDPGGAFCPVWLTWRANDRSGRAAV